MSGLITYEKFPHKEESDLCEVCGAWIDDGDEVWYHGDGVFTCSEDCRDEYDKE
ncbi:MAG: hypothetical protein WC783_05960 [Candidatus Paceibacterota bacterium]|jgi:hypothetical protein